MTALALPGLAPTTTWTIRRCSDSAARQLADRHYSRRTPGAAMFAPPGYALVLVTPCERAAWVTSYTKHPDDGLDAWRCSLFRTEGAGLASDLILVAMAVTAERWGDAPPDGWLTYIDTAKVKGPNPGYCFFRAGWWKDRTYRPDRRRATLIRLRAA